MNVHVVLGSLFHFLRRPFLRAVLIPWFFVSTGIGVVPLQSPVAIDLGIALALGGTGLFAWSAWEMAFIGHRTTAGSAGPQAGSLVTSGPYGIVRHPLYDAILLIQLAWLLAFPSILVAVWLAITAYLFLRGVPRGEEARLRVHFGATYDRYAAEVPRWLPRLSAVPARGSKSI